MKKHRIVLLLIVCLLCSITGCGEKKKEKTALAFETGFRDVDFEISLDERFKMDCILAETSILDGANSYNSMLEWFQSWYQGAFQQNAIRYQMTVPCHFFVTQFFGKDPLNTYEYRNIDENDEALWKDGIRINEAPAYVADMIIDTYIREYG